MHDRHSPRVPAPPAREVLSKPLATRDIARALASVLARTYPNEMSDVTAQAPAEVPRQHI